MLKNITIGTLETILEIEDVGPDLDEAEKPQENETAERLNIGDTGITAKNAFTKQKFSENNISSQTTSINNVQIGEGNHEQIVNNGEGQSVNNGEGKTVNKGDGKQMKTENKIESVQRIGDGNDPSQKWFPYSHYNSEKWTQIEEITEPTIAKIIKQSKLILETQKHYLQEKAKEQHIKKLVKRFHQNLQTLSKNINNLSNKSDLPAIKAIEEKIQHYLNLMEPTQCTKTPQNEQKVRMYEPQNETKTTQQKQIPTMMKNVPYRENVTNEEMNDEILDFKVGTADSRGDCLFDSVSQILKSEGRNENKEILRKITVQCGSHYSDNYLDQIVGKKNAKLLWNQLGQPQFWNNTAGDLAPAALSQALFRPIIILENINGVEKVTLIDGHPHESKGIGQNPSQNNENEPLVISRSHGCHFSPVWCSIKVMNQWRNSMNHMLAEDKTSMELKTLKKYINDCSSTVTQCPLCKRECYGPSSLKKHIEDTHQCNICDKTFRDRQDIKAHMMEQHTCAYCNQDCIDRLSLEVHITNQHKCQYCDKMFRNSITLNGHKQDTHKCNRCDRYLANRDEHIKLPHDIQTVIETLIQNKDWNCQICKKTETNLDQLIEHSVAKHVDQTKNLAIVACPLCNVTANSQLQIQKHRETDHKTWKCQECGKNFEENQELQTHIAETHCKCPAKECDKTFRNKNLLEHHIRKSKHSEHQCKKCNSYVKNQEEMLKHESESKICNITMIKEKQKFYRLLLQAQFINQHLELQAVSLPTFKDFMALCRPPKKVFGILDMTSWFFQIGCSKQYSKFFTFSSHLGSHSYLRACMGDASSPYAGQKCSRMITNSVEDALPMVDDILIASETAHQFLDALEQILDNMEEMSEPGQPITIRADKSACLHSSVRYHGHIISRNTVRPDPLKVKRAIDWPIPETLNQLMSFNGLVSFFREFIPDCSGLIRSLTDLAKTAPRILGEHWKEKHKKSFETVKDRLKTLPSLRIYQPNLPIHVFHDASDDGYGGIVCQDVKTDHGNKLYPLHFWSKTCNQQERNYSTPEAELQSLSLMLLRYRTEILGNHLTIHSDSSIVYWSLRGLATGQLNYSKTLQRLAVLLQGISFDLKHISSEKQPADWFSRLARKKPIEEVKVKDSKRKLNLPDIQDGIIVPNDKEISVIEAADFSLQEHNQQVNEPHDFHDDSGETVATIGTQKSPDNWGICYSDKQKRTISYNTNLSTESTEKDLIPHLLTRLEDDLSEKIYENEEHVAVITRRQTDLEEIGEMSSDLNDAQRKDPNLAPIIDKVIHAPDNVHTQYGQEFILRGGTLIAKDIATNRRKYVAPEQFLPDLITAAHTRFHQGIDKTKRRLEEKWWLFSPKKSVQKILQQCFTCQAYGTNKKGNNPHPNMPGQIATAGRPNEVICMDIWSPGDRNGSRYTKMVLAIDLFSRFCWIRPLTAATSENIAQFLIEDVFTCAIPRKIITDNARNISGGELPRLYEAINRGAGLIKTKTDTTNTQPENEEDFDPDIVQPIDDIEDEHEETEIIKQANSSPWHPQGNAVCERVFRNVKDWLSKALEDKPDDWHKLAPLLIHLYNNSYHDALQTSPAHVMMGKRPEHFQPDILQTLAEGGTFSESSYIREQAKQMKIALDLANDEEHSSKYFHNSRQKMLNRDRSTREHDFKLGSLLMVKRHGPRLKLDPRGTYMGPARVIGLEGEHLVTIQYLCNGYIRRINASKCKPFFADSTDRLKDQDRFTGPKYRDAKMDFPATDGTGMIGPHGNEDYDDLIIDPAVDDDYDDLNDESDAPTQTETEQRNDDDDALTQTETQQRTTIFDDIPHQEPGPYKPSTQTQQSTEENEQETETDKENITIEDPQQNLQDVGTGKLIEIEEPPMIEEDEPEENDDTEPLTTETEPDTELENDRNLDDIEETLAPMPKQTTELQDMMMNQDTNIWNTPNRNVSQETANEMVKKVIKQNKNLLPTPQHAKIPSWTDIPTSKQLKTQKEDEKVVTDFDESPFTTPNQIPDEDIQDDDRVEQELVEPPIQLNEFMLEDEFDSDDEKPDKKVAFREDTYPNVDKAPCPLHGERQTTK